MFTSDDIGGPSSKGAFEVSKELLPQLRDFDSVSLIYCIFAFTPRCRQLINPRKPSGMFVKGNRMASVWRAEQS